MNRPRGRPEPSLECNRFLKAVVVNSLRVTPKSAAFFFAFRKTGSSSTSVVLIQSYIHMQTSNVNRYRVVHPFALILGLVTLLALDARPSTLDARRSTLDARRSTLDLRLSHFSFSAFQLSSLTPLPPGSRGALSGLPTVVFRTASQQLGSGFRFRISYFLQLTTDRPHPLTDSRSPLPLRGISHFPFSIFWVCT